QASHHRSSSAARRQQWNEIEHRLFSFTSINWRGKPPRSYRTIVQLIAATTNCVSKSRARNTRIFVIGSILPYFGCPKALAKGDFRRRELMQPASITRVPLARSPDAARIDRKG